MVRKIKESHHSRHKKEKSGRHKRGIFRTMLWVILAQVRIILEYVIDKIFGLLYDSHKEIVPPTKNPILLQSVTVLAESIRDKRYSCTEVVEAFINRAKEVNPILNAIVDERFNEAIEDAKRIDEEIAKGVITSNDFEEKPLLGIPFTSKDSTACKGMLQTLGLVSRKFERAKEDADVIVLFKKAGAILIATTNIPEVNMWQETRNMLYGQTKNPYDTTRTTGGSSGGEAALIASCGSAVGIGTDIGGSLRMPAYFCGIFTHKATGELISTKGLTLRTGLETNTMVVPGPMCRNGSDLIPLLKVLLGGNQSKLKLDTPVDINEVKIYFTIEPNCNRMSRVSQDVQSSMQRAIQFLTGKQRDFKPELVQFENMQYAFQYWRHEMTKENLDLGSAFANFKGRVNVYTEFLKKIIGQSEFTIAALMVLANRYVLPQENALEMEDRLSKLKEEILNLLGDNGVLIFPSYPTTAPYHYVQITRPYNMGFWSVFNALRLPVTQVPLGLSSDGLPLGLQIVTSPFNDHLAIAIARILEEEFNGWVPFLDDDKKI